LQKMIWKKTQLEEESRNNVSRRKAERIVLGVIAAGLLLAPATTWIFNVPHNLPLLGHYQCPFLYLTGLPCAGCGMTRAIFAFFHGEFAVAIRYNAIFPLYLLIWAYLITICGSRAFFSTKLPVRTILYALPVILALVFTFWIWRLWASL